MDSCAGSFAPFHDLQVLVWAWLQWQMSLQHIGECTLPTLFVFLYFLFSPSLGEACCGTVWSMRWCISTMGCKFHAQVAEKRWTYKSEEPMWNVCRLKKCVKPWTRGRLWECGRQHLRLSWECRSYSRSRAELRQLRPWKRWVTRLQICQFLTSIPCAFLVWHKIKAGNGQRFFFSVAFHFNKFHLIQRKCKVRQLHLETFARDSGPCGPRPQYTRSMMVLVADFHCWPECS